MPETLCEDTVYSFLIPTSSLNDSELSILCESINKTVQILSLEYIWHKDEFKVHIPIRNNNIELPGHLASITCFGDNIEDEWFIVYLLLEISKRYSNLVIQVYDNDGEFLLIEAADNLPSWANPDNTENRVFIYGGNIHLIPPNILDLESEINLNDTVNIVVEKSEYTKSPAIQEAVLKRIGDYPDKIVKNIHRAVVNLPLEIATLLTFKPCLISPIVIAYCNHDAIDAKACKNVKLENCVKTQVKFTKCLYAMLTHSKVVKTVKHVRINENDKKSSLGLKICCGYEMIMSNLSGDIFSTKEFIKFLKSLTDNGFFKDNIEGSKDYKLLLEQAKDFFLAMECPINTQVCNDILQLMKTKKFTDLKEMIKLKPTDNLADDNDDWLNVNPDQLNDMLNSRYGRQTTLKSGDIIDSDTITSELSNFLKQTSDFEGIETEMEDEENTIHFNSEEFMNSLKNMMDFLSLGNKEDAGIGDIDDFSEDDLVKELGDKLNTDVKIGSPDNKSILHNMIKSMKEEAGSSGPSSNIFKTIGINKIDIIDSDDDEMAEENG